MIHRMRARSTLAERSAPAHSVSGRPFASQPFVSLALAAVVLAAAVLWVLAPLGRDAEVRYLALWIAGLVTIVALLARHRGVEAVLAALGGVTLVWVVPPLPATRAVAVGVLLTVVFVGAVVRRWRDVSSASPVPGAVWVASALGAQWLLRSSLLIESLTAPHAWVGLFVLPGIAGVAGSWLARRYGWRRVLVAMMVVAVLGPGFHLAGVLALVAFAASTVAFERAYPRAARLLAMATVLAPILWQPRAGVLIAGAAIALCGPRFFALAIAVLALVIAALPAAFVPFAVQGWSGAVGFVVWLPFLVPALLVPTREAKQALWAVGALTLLGARLLPATEILQSGVFAAPLALAALTVRSRGAAIQAQLAWSAILFSATTVLAAYPWLRPRPLADAVALFGVEPGLQALLAALSLCGLLWVLDRFSEESPAATGEPPPEPSLLLNRPAACVIVAVVLATAVSLPRSAEELDYGSGLVFDRDHPSQGIHLERTLTGLAIESRLANAAALADGTPVATLTLTDSEGKLHRYTLKAGRDTGEWAARRQDVAQISTLRDPPVWRSRVDAGGTFFANTYKTVWTFQEDSDRPLHTARLELARDPELPPEVTVVVTRLELLP